MKKVLVLEDEANIRSFIVINLRRAGYEVIEAESGEEALEKLAQNKDVCLCLFDVMLPGIDGFEVCRRVRAGNPHIGIIMLTARSQEMDKVTGLMTGADDYVTKPFSPAELTARVDALIRRSGGMAPQSVQPADEEELVSPPFTLNLRNRTLEKNGERIKLTQLGARAVLEDQRAVGDIDLLGEIVDHLLLFGREDRLSGFFCGLFLDGSGDGGGVGSGGDIAQSELDFRHGSYLSFYRSDPLLRGGALDGQSFGEAVGGHHGFQSADFSADIELIVGIEAVELLFKGFGAQ